MKNCKLCQLLGTAQPEDNGDNSAMDACKPKDHAEIHRRQLQMVTGQKFSLEETMQKCFGLELNQEQGVTENSIDVDVKRENSRPRKNSKSGNNHPSVICPISKVCYELYEKHGRKKTMTCSECTNPLIVVAQGCLNSRRVKDHACIHLNKEMFQCRFCEYKCPNNFAIDMHLFRIHKVKSTRRNYIDQSSEYEADIIGMIRRCFGQTQPLHGMVKRAKRVTALNGLDCKCQNGKIICSACGKQLTVIMKKGSANVKVMVNHVNIHLEKMPFQCMLCEYGAAAKGTMAKHLKKVHKRDCTDDETCKDLSEQQQDEVLAMIKRCFASDPQQVTKRLDRQKVTYRTKICNQLFKHRKRNELIACSKCMAEIDTLDGSKKLLDHAHKHIGKVMFTCKICQYQCVLKSSIYIHIPGKHGMSLKDNYTDSTMDNEQLINDMMTECFGQNDKN